jgi:hypothetical protein
MLHSCFFQKNPFLDLDQGKALSFLVFLYRITDKITTSSSLSTFGVTTSRIHSSKKRQARKQPEETKGIKHSILEIWWSYGGFHGKLVLEKRRRKL